MAFADGVPTHVLLDDLRHVKLSKNARARVLFLTDKFKTSNLAYEEERELRVLYNRHQSRVIELHRSYERVRATNAAMRRGGRDSELREEAKQKSKIRLRRKLRALKKEIQEYEAEEKDFGF